MGMVLIGSSLQFSYEMIVIGSLKFCYAYVQMIFIFLESFTFMVYGCILFLVTYTHTNVFVIPIINLGWDFILPRVLKVLMMVFSLLARLTNLGSSISANNWLCFQDIIKLSMEKEYVMETL